MEVTSPAPDVFSVHAERPAWGKSESSGTAVYHYRRADVWECERCGTSSGTSNPECLHVRCVRESLAPQWP